jgi:hypothetical protein
MNGPTMAASAPIPTALAWRDSNKRGSRREPDALGTPLGIKTSTLNLTKKSSTTERQAATKSQQAREERKEISDSNLSALCDLLFNSSQKSLRKNAGL